MSDDEYVFAGDTVWINPGDGACWTGEYVIRRGPGRTISVKSVDRGGPRVTLSDLKISLRLASDSEFARRALGRNVAKQFCLDHELTNYQCMAEQLIAEGVLADDQPTGVVEQLLAEGEEVPDSLDAPWTPHDVTRQIREVAAARARCEAQSALYRLGLERLRKRLGYEPHPSTPYGEHVTIRDARVAIGRS